MSPYWVSLIASSVPRVLGAVAIVLGLLSFKFPRIRGDESPWVLILFGSFLLLVGIPLTTTFANV